VAEAVAEMVASVSCWWRKKNNFAEVKRGRSDDCSKHGRGLLAVALMTCCGLGGRQASGGSSWWLGRRREKKNRERCRLGRKTNAEG